jgi:CDP-diacylglycerol--serine O-phosphatidyltransferase
MAPRLDPAKLEARRARFRAIPIRTLVPNVITLLALCAGLTAIRMAAEGRLELALGAIVFAAALDGIDGRIARALKASSRFGAQMDSLADIVNFGVAPALVLYAFLLHMAGSIGWIAALLFAIACGLRLARFNVMIEGYSHPHPAWQSDYFVGVPAPAGAVLVMLPIYLGFLGLETGRVFAVISAFYAVLVALLMISRLPVYSGKSMGKVRRDIVVPLMLAVVLYVLLLTTYTWQTITLSAIAYLIFLPLSMRSYTRRAEVEESVETAGQDDET